MKMDPALLHAPKTILPGAVTVMHGRAEVIEQLGIVQHQFFGEHGFATTGGSHDQDTGRGLKTEGFSQHDDDDSPQKTEKKMMADRLKDRPFY